MALELLGSLSLLGSGAGATAFDVHLDAWSSKTGLISGGIISINGGDNTKIDISAGSGIVVDWETDPENPTAVPVTWTAFTAVTVTNLASSIASTIFIDDVGAVQQTGEEVSTPDMQEMINLGVAAHPDGATVSSVSNNSTLAYGAGVMAEEFIRLFGLLNISGNIYSPNGANLLLNKSTGVTWGISSNKTNDLNDPNKLVDGLQTGIANYIQSFRDGTGGFSLAFTSAIDPSVWDDDSGTPAAVSANKWTIKVIRFGSGLGVTTVELGQKEYNSQAEAEAGVMEAISTNPAISKIARRLWLITKNNTTDLEDSEVTFINVPDLDLGGTSTGGTAGSGDVIGPVTSTDNSLVRFDGTDSKVIQDSGIIVDDSDNVTGIRVATFDANITVATHVALAGAVVGDAPSSANDLIIGNGTSSPGLTIFGSGAQSGSVVFTDTSGVIIGQISYDHNQERFEWIVEGGNELVLSTAQLMPAGNLGLHLGGTSNRWNTIFGATADLTGNLDVGGGVSVAGLVRATAGVYAFDETTTPTPIANVGKIYPKSDNRLYFQDGAGVEHEVGGGPTFKSYTLTTQGIGSGTFYSAGWYNAPAADANLDSAVGVTATIGGANGAAGAHAFIVAGGVGTASGGTGAVEIEVSGTSITESGTRTTSDTEVIVADITALVLDDYAETEKKWIGTVTFTLQLAGGSTQTAFAVDVNYGLAKYDDFGNRDFTVTDFEVTGLAGANDSGFNITLCHHTTTGWTYHATAFVPGAEIIVDMGTDYSTESNLVNTEPFAYKRVGLSTAVAGAVHSGVIIRFVTTANNAIEFAESHIGVDF